jgi:hypothetical protein
VRIPYLLLQHLINLTFVFSEEEQRHEGEKEEKAKEMEELKAKYEQQIVEVERTLTDKIRLLEQIVSDLRSGGLDGSSEDADGDSGLDSLSHKLAQQQHRQYVHQTATLTAISDESDTAESPRGSSEPSSRVQQLQEEVKEKEHKMEELEKQVTQLEEEKEQVSMFSSSSFHYLCCVLLSTVGVENLRLLVIYTCSSAAWQPDVSIARLEAEAVMVIDSLLLVPLPDVSIAGL